MGAFWVECVCVRERRSLFVTSEGGEVSHKVVQHVLAHARQTLCKFW